MKRSNYLIGLINKYRFGGDRFYKSFDVETSSINLFENKICVDAILRDKVVEKQIQVTSFVIRKSIEDDLVMEVTGIFKQDNTIKTKYVERRKTARTY